MNSVMSWINISLNTSYMFNYNFKYTYNVELQSTYILEKEIKNLKIIKYSRGRRVGRG